jgi:hypothetical protein
MSTTTSNPPPPVMRRALVAAGRLVRFSWLARQCDAILIFSGDGSGFVEKGAMCLIAAAAKPTILRLAATARPAMRAKPRVCVVGSMVLRRVSVVTCQSAHWVDFVQSMTDGRTRVEIGNGVCLTLPSAREHPLHIGFLGWTNGKRARSIRLPPSSASSRMSRVRFCAWLRRPRYAAFTAEVTRLGLTKHVECLGWLPRDQIAAFLQSLNVLVLPSYAEGCRTPSSKRWPLACSSWRRRWAASPI